MCCPGAVRTVLPLLDQFLGFLDNLVARAVPYVSLVAALIIADMIGDRHENRVIVNPSRRRFDSNHVIRLPLQHQHARLNADIRLERVGVEVDAGKNASIAENPLAHVSKPRRAQDAVWQHDGAPPCPRLQKLDTSFDEQDFGRLRLTDWRCSFASGRRTCRRMVRKSGRG